MAEIDPELIERTLRWCAEAGRQTTPPVVRAALGPLSWDELLAAQALLADPPPLRPLGPFALADLARGAPADVAAERERAGNYGAAERAIGEPAGTGPARKEPGAPSPARGRKRKRPPFVVRRASERSAPPAASPRALPLLDVLLLDEGRAEIERLIRRHGGRRARILESLASGWRRADGASLDDASLDRLLAQHGLARSFEIRERDEILHALRASGGLRARAAEALGLDLPGLDGALDRLGIRQDAEGLRDQRRRELRARGTLTQRSHLLLDEPERLADLGLLEEFTRDLAARLPDHVRALTASSSDAPADLLGRSLSLDARGVERLLQQTGIVTSTLGGSAPRPKAPVRPAPARRGGRDAPRAGGAERRPPPRKPSGGPRRPGGSAGPARRRPGGPGPRRGPRPTKGR